MAGAAAPVVHRSSALFSRRTFLEGLSASLGGGRGGASPWPSGAPGAVSLTYDDGLVSHLQYAAPAVTARGWKANFFLTLENMADRMADWRALAAQGHEIGNHTVHHYCDLRPLNPSRYMQSEIADAQAVFDAQFGPQPKLFAYPCGVTNLGQGDANQQQRLYVQQLRARGFIGARTSDGEPMSPGYAWRRRFALNATAPTYEADCTAEAFDYLDAAVRQGRWAILVFHGLGPTRKDSGDTSNGVHDAILDAIIARKMWCAPIGQVLDHLRLQQA